jgi:hypothetical protein
MAKATEPAPTAPSYVVKTGQGSLSVFYGDHEADQTGRYSHVDVVADPADMVPASFQAYFNDGRANSIAVEVLDDLTNELGKLA